MNDSPLENKETIEIISEGLRKAYSKEKIFSEKFDEYLNSLLLIKPEPMELARCIIGNKDYKNVEDRIARETQEERWHYVNLIRSELQNYVKISNFFL